MPVPWKARTPLGTSSGGCETASFDLGVLDEQAAPCQGTDFFRRFLCGESAVRVLEPETRDFTGFRSGAAEGIGRLAAAGDRRQGANERKLLGNGTDSAFGW